MKAMILAAGRGERMRPLTDNTPKPLLKVHGKALIEHHIEALVGAGIHDIVINHAWLGEQIEESLGGGERYGASIVYSPEGIALETGGGIYKALPLLGTEPFVVINGDVLTDFPYAKLPRNPTGIAHLVFVPNPPHNPDGDFGLDDGYAAQDAIQKYTFSGIGVYRANLFSQCRPGTFPLAPLLSSAMDKKLVTAELYRGRWVDIGTPQRLQEINLK